MKSPSRLFLIVPLCGLLLATSSTTPLSQRQRALHALNRLGFGARPGDVDRVVKMGVDKWIDQQLHPERIADSAVDVRLRELPTLSLSNAQIWERFYAPIIEKRKEKRRDGSVAAQKDAAGAAGGERQIPYEERPQRLIDELSAQRIIRAAESERQLNEVMVDFWMNHFNIYSGKGVDRVYLTSYERDVVRPHIWGRFEDLLLATAKSPAMLFYLDNARSTAEVANRPSTVRRDSPRSRRGGFINLSARRRNRLPDEGDPREMRDPLQQQRMAQPPAKAQAGRAGLNENYAREIMELHTLGVNAGYTQKDVTELARVLTGWAIARPEEGGGFAFRERVHDVKSKTVLGVHFAAGGGIEEGERMIHLLAHHPATAHHIALQLCQRLVSDEPPAVLVDRVAKRFLDSDGDLRQTVRAVIDSPEFWDPRNYQAKVKSPFEYVISAVRALNPSSIETPALMRALQQIGEPLYGAQPPTGYSDAASAWVNSGALLNRLNFALDMAGGKLAGVRPDVASLAGTAGVQEPVESLAVALTGGGLSESTRKTIEARLSNDKGATPADRQLALMAGLILGSPEFQKQ